MRNSDIEESVLRTLLYADIFDYPMREEEVCRWIITRIQDSEFRIQEKKEKSKKGEDTKEYRGDQEYPPSPRLWRTGQVDQVRKALEGLVKKGLISTEGKYYCLRGRGEIFQLRKRRERFSRQKWEVARKVGEWLEWLPMVRMVAVTGALAMNNCEEEDDIDLMIITSDGWLWTTRLVVTLMLELLGLRRKPGDVRVADKVCVNVWLSEGDLLIEPGKQGLYLAHEILQAEPVVVKGDIYTRFLKANEWVREWLGNAWEWRWSLEGKESGRLGKLGRSGKGKQKSKFLERLAFRFQRWYMRGRKTREEVSVTRAMFHPEDVGGEIMSKFKAQISKLQLKS